MNKIQILNLGIGNPQSIQNILFRLGYDSEFIQKSSDLKGKVLFIPGVGSFDYAINILNNYNWIEALKEYVNKGNWILGICLGMQILCESSDEGKLKGLNFIPGKFKKFRVSKTLKVPHMGWNYLKFKKNKNCLIDFTSLNQYEMKFYFVHSYHYHNSDNFYISGNTLYEQYFPSIVGNQKVIGFQFHPEKSHVYGLKLLKFTLGEIFQYD